MKSITDADLVRRIRRRGKRSEAAEQTLMLRHKPIIRIILNRYRSKREQTGNAIPPVADIEDLFQVGWVAMLMVAKDKPPKGWDPDHGTKFISFAKRRILWAIQQELTRIPKAMNTGIDLAPITELLPEDEPPDVSTLLAALTPLEAALITGVYGLDGIYKANLLEDRNGKPGSVHDMAARLGLAPRAASQMIAQALEKMRALGYGDTADHTG